MSDSSNDRSPPTWKVMILKWLALFPVLLVLSYLIEWLPVDPALWLKLMIETMITVPLLNYVITPWIDRTFENWLYAGIDPERSDAA